ncbi:RNA polymerase sigma factor [Paenibacillus sp. J31TS4]|uniref:RNA polymerase sigma factor n=1 Tax=Paenibacillus sp. J31TS4 TaxID=2807195 RepID=UPI001B050E94|nr:sigma-70 family RNA polymerase sigma factor [Paenibacillus sp. J31TS4]GIP38141.1 RNA polymerase sigma factor [Paenibacillus sp. J31TS4]
MNEEYLRYIGQPDAAVIEDLTLTYWNDVWNYAYLITKDYSLSSDIAQDVFVKAFQSLHTFRGEASVKTWLLRIARNTAYTEQRSAFFRRVILSPSVRFGGSAPSAEAEYMEQELASEVWKYAMALPRHYREVLILDARHELSIGEIASLLNVSEGTVKSRLHRARRGLAEKLAKEGLLC